MCSVAGLAPPVTMGGVVSIATLDPLVCSAFGLQALQEIEPRQRPTDLLKQPAIAQIA